jgi:hypothetical protein
LSVDAVHAKPICEDDIAVATNPLGTLGGVVSGTLLTVSVATPLVALPAVLLTTTRNVDPLSAVVVAAVV